ncbi:MAG: PfaB family protein [Coleofasciculus sp. C1-SOL-03]|uniref:PfaB family protein n=1 Tax=Coleofasciculus sp. C1-SOL-03 TaxID=3069522 RepID=UPI0032FED50D
MVRKLAIVGMDSIWGTCHGLDEFEYSIYHANQYFSPISVTGDQDLSPKPSPTSAVDCPQKPALWGAYLKDFQIDVFRYKIPPNDLEHIDPKQLLLLKVCDQALKDAGLDQTEKKRLNLAVVAVIDENLMGEDEPNYQHIDDDDFDQKQNSVFQKLAKLWSICGPNFTVCLAENSVVEALETANMLLTMAPVDAVVVAAVHLTGDSAGWLEDSAKMTMGIPTLSYDCNASGVIRGEGAGAIVVKRYERAKFDRDRIYATIDAVHLIDETSAPPATSVSQTCQMALAQAGVNPTDIGYLEVFASGVEAQDQAEIQGLLSAYQVSHPELSCAIGSVKATIGHTYVASGIASLIKTALCLYHRYIPATPQWSTPKWEQLGHNSPFYVATESRPWFLSPEQPKRIAAINSLGSDGTYAHLIVSEDSSQGNRSQRSVPQLPVYLFAIAGNNSSELLEQLNTLEQAIQTSASLSATASETFARFQRHPQAPYALAIVGRTQDELRREIQRGRQGIPNAFAQHKDWKSPLGSYFTAKPLGKQGAVAFVYPGAFNSYMGMGRKLFHLFPKLHDKAASFIANPSLFFREKLLYPRRLNKLSKRQLEDLEGMLMADPLAMLETGTGLAVLLTVILREYFRVQPQMAFGYSMGESTMMYALDVWTKADYGSNFLQRSPLFQSRLVGGKTTVVDHWGIPEQERNGKELWRSYVLMAAVSSVRDCIQTERRVYLTHINTPTEVVIAGEPQACQRVIEALNCDFFSMPSNMVLHCQAMASEYNQLRQLNRLSVENVPEIAFYSSANYAPIPLNQDAIAHHLAQGVCQDLDFPRLVNRVYDDGARIFIELGAGGTCCRWIREILKHKEQVSLCMNRRGVDDDVAVVKVLAQLLSHRVSVDLSPLYDAVPDAVLNRKSWVKTVRLNSNKMPSAVSISVADPGASESVESIPSPAADTQSSPMSLNADQVLDVTEGKVSPIFGQEYKGVDSYARRVRLPSPPYQFVSRVTQLNGKRGDYRSGFIQTEYDIPLNAWYSVDGQVPLGICEEAGHGLLLLLSYLGSDFESQGKRSFRLLDLTATFVDKLPEAPETLRYDIRITASVKTTDSLLIFFKAEGFVNDKIYMKLQEGCAGLFSDQDLAQGQGVVGWEREQSGINQGERSLFIPLLTCQKGAFTSEDLLHLSQGNLAACLGETYHQKGVNPSLRLPPPALRMIDQVISVDTTGGAAGLGLIMGARFVQPDDWYFLCHFKNDPTMPGSLMIEGATELLQFYCLFLGLQTCTINARFQPIPHHPQVARFRGQVTPSTGRLIYRLDITELGVSPQPYVIGNVQVIWDDKVIAYVKELGIQLSEQPQQVLPEANNFPPKPALFNQSQIQHLTQGDLASCLGSDYHIYDTRRSVCLPNSDLGLVSRVLDARGEPHEFNPSSSVVTEYDVAGEAWFLRQNAYPDLPYFAYIELSGQPCIFMGLYLGVPLVFPDEDLYFRNLDGQGTILKSVDVRGKTITDQVRLLSTTTIQGVIIQAFDFQLFCEDELFYQGTMVFGYFSQSVLAKQVGLDGGKVVRPWYEQRNCSGLSAIPIDLRTPMSRQKFYQVNPSKPYYRLADHQLDFLDQVLMIEAGGDYGQGYIYARKTIRPTDWYFPCHFKQDPVMPGALGVEAILQAMKVYALQLDLGKSFQSPRFVQVLNHQITWKYRGQITPENRQLYLEVHISTVEVSHESITIRGDASLWKDEMRIYQVNDVAIGLVDSAASGDAWGERC